MCVVLIHPNVLADKLRFQQAFVAKMREAGAWLGPLGEFAAWWEARDGVQVGVDAAAGRARVILRSAVPVKGLALQLPTDWRIAPASSLAEAQSIEARLARGESWHRFGRSQALREWMQLDTRLRRHGGFAGITIQSFEAFEAAPA